MVDAEVEVVVSAEVVSPELGAVDLIADRVLEIVVVGNVFDVDLGRPGLGAVSVGLAVAERLIAVGIPAVGGVSDEYVLVISVVLENRVDLIRSQAAHGAEALSGYGSGTDDFGAVVISAVVVVPDGLAVCLVLDGVLASEAGEGRLPDLGAVVQGGHVGSRCVTPAETW